MQNHTVIAMNQSLVDKINREIYRRFPEFAGIKPKVQRQSAAQAKTITATPTYLLTFQSRAEAPGNKSMSRWVRVVANEDGKILKVTTSR
jgi:hypothetical protein